jgi:Spy/CpxP family protein refolding chaperone
LASDASIGHMSRLFHTLLELIMKRLLACGIMATILVAAPLSVQAQHGKHTVGKLKQELALTDAQVEQLKAVLKDVKSTRPERSGNKEADRAAMQKHRESVDAKIKALLTAEQQAKFDAMKEKAGERRKGGRGR